MSKRGQRRFPRHHGRENGIRGGINTQDRLGGPLHHRPRPSGCPPHRRPSSRKPTLRRPTPSPVRPSDVRSIAGPAPWMSGSSPVRSPASRLTASVPRSRAASVRAPGIGGDGGHAGGQPGGPTRSCRPGSELTYEMRARAGRRGPARSPAPYVHGPDPPGHLVVEAIGPRVRAALPPRRPEQPGLFHLGSQRRGVLGRQRRRSTEIIVTRPAKPPPRTIVTLIRTILDECPLKDSDLLPCATHLLLFVTVDTEQFSGHFHGRRGRFQEIGAGPQPLGERDVPDPAGALPGVPPRRWPRGRRRGWGCRS